MSIREITKITTVVTETEIVTEGKSKEFVHFLTQLNRFLILEATTKGITGSTKLPTTIAMKVMVEIVTAVNLITKSLFEGLLLTSLKLT